MTPRPAHLFYENSHICFQARKFSEITMKTITIEFGTFQKLRNRKYYRRSLADFVYSFLAVQVAKTNLSAKLLHNIRIYVYSDTVSIGDLTTTFGCCYPMRKARASDFDFQAWAWGPGGIAFGGWKCSITNRLSLYSPSAVQR